MSLDLTKPMHTPEKLVAPDELATIRAENAALREEIAKSEESMLKAITPTLDKNNHEIDALREELQECREELLRQWRTAHGALCVGWCATNNHCQWPKPKILKGK